MSRFLLVLLLVGLFAAWWLGYVPGRTPAGVVDRVDPAAARQRGAQVGERVADGVNRATQAVDDATLTAKIKSKMALDDVVSASDIDVDTVDGVVTLTGVVRSEQERERATQLARETLGVRTVNERLRPAR